MVKMNLDELKNFFCKFSMDSLESLGTLVLSSNPLEIALYLGVYRAEFNKRREEYEGINEYDYICRIKNFRLIELESNVSLFNKKELTYLYDTLCKAPKKDIISKYKKIIDNKLSDDLSYDELLILFDKYNITQLDVIKNIFQYIKDYDMSLVNSALNDVYLNDGEQYYHSYEVPVYSDLSNVNSLLSDKELEFLYYLVECADSYLSSLQENYRNDIEDFDIEEYPISFVSKLENSLCEEIDSRRSSKKFRKILI